MGGQSSKVSVIEQISVDSIEPGPCQTRLFGYDASIDSLAKSLRNVGQLAPVRLRPHPTREGVFQIIYGHRRWAAAKKLGWKTIHAEVSSAGDEHTALLALIENLERKDLSDYEKAVLFETLHTRFEKTYEEIGKMIGKTKQYVANHAAMLRLFDDDTLEEPGARDILHYLSEHHARILLRLGEPKDRLAYARLVVEEGLCVRETDKLIGRRHGKFARSYENGREYRNLYTGAPLLKNNQTGLRVCILSVNHLNTLIQNLKVSPYELGKLLGRQALPPLNEIGLNPCLRQEWQGALDSLARKGWGAMTVEDDIITASKIVFEDTDFLRGYLESFLGADLVEMSRDAHHIRFRVK